MRLFLDTCCLNRPWDDQTRLRIHLEAEAVLYVLYTFQTGQHEMVTSDYLIAEILSNTDTLRRSRVMALLQPAAWHVRRTQPVEARAASLTQFGFGGFDALHIAAGEHAGCSWLLTTDDRLIRRASRATNPLHLHVINPIDFPAASSQP
jgi:predicted nucleic acid-binding protein